MTEPAPAPAPEPDDVPPEPDEADTAVAEGEVVDPGRDDPDGTVRHLPDLVQAGNEVTTEPKTALPDQIVGLPSWDELRIIEYVSSKVAGTEMVPKNIRHKPDAVMGAVLAGRELRIPFMQALRDISMVEGTPTPSAKLVRELIRRNPNPGAPGPKHQVELLSTPDDITEARYRFRRADWPEDRWKVWSFTFAQAEQAGLVRMKDGKPYARSQSGKALPWELYTSALLRARALTSLGREWFAECLGSLLYTAEELGVTWVDEYGAPAEDTRTPAQVRWDNMMDKLTEDEQGRARQFFNEQAGQPFAHMTLERQEQWADWLEGVIAKKQAERDRPSILRADHEVGMHDESPDDDCPLCRSDESDEDGRNGEGDTDAPADPDADDSGGDAADGEASEGELPDELDPDDPEVIHGRIEAAIDQYAEALGDEAADAYAAGLMDRYALNGPYWSQLEPDDAAVVLHDIDSAIQAHDPDDDE